MYIIIVAWFRELVSMQTIGMVSEAYVGEKCISVSTAGDILKAGGNPGFREQLFFF